MEQDTVQKNTLKFVGLDMSKDKIYVTIAVAGREAPRFLVIIPHDINKVRKLLNKLGSSECLEVCTLYSA